MSCFRIPKTLCNRVTSSALHFWWSTNPQNKGIHWVRKEIMEKEKVKGGMGFRCLESLNTAMLLKCLWRILNNPELLVSKVLRAKYYRHGNLLEAKSNSSSSFAWKSLVGTMEVFKAGVISGDERNLYKWKGSVDGTYSVRTGYALALQYKLSTTSNGGEPSNMENHKSVWSKLWKLKLPDRIRIFTCGDYSMMQCRPLIT